MIRSSLRRIGQALCGVSVIATEAFAAGGSLPWESKLATVRDSITGPTAAAIAAIVIVGAGLAMTFSEGGGVMRKLAWVGFGLSITAAAVNFSTSFFGFSQGMPF